MTILLLICTILRTALFIISHLIDLIFQTLGWQSVSTVNSAGAASFFLGGHKKKKNAVWDHTFMTFTQNGGGKPYNLYAFVGSIIFRQ